VMTVRFMIPSAGVWGREHRGPAFRCRPEWPAAVV